MTKEIKKVMNLDNPIPEDSLNGYLFSNENKGHKFIISCTKGGELQALTGSVTVRFMRANNTTILLGQGGSDGRENYAQIVDGNAEVALHPDCYNVPGRFKISVFNISGDTVSCIYVGVGTVSRTQNGELIDSGEIVPSIDELVGYIDDCIAATENAEAAAEHAVRYDVAQTLTDTQKAQARTNIDASSQSDVDDLKSAINKSVFAIAPDTFSVEPVQKQFSYDSNNRSSTNKYNYPVVLQNISGFVERIRLNVLTIGVLTIGCYKKSGLGTASPYVDSDWIYLASIYADTTGDQTFIFQQPVYIPSGYVLAVGKQLTDTLMFAYGNDGVDKSYYYRRNTQNDWNLSNKSCGLDVYCISIPKDINNVIPMLYTIGNKVQTEIYKGFDASNNKSLNLGACPILPLPLITNAVVTGIKANILTAGILSIGVYSDDVVSGETFDETKYKREFVINISGTGEQTIDFPQPLLIYPGSYLAIGRTTDTAIFAYGANGYNKSYIYPNASTRIFTTSATNSLGIDVYGQALRITNNPQSIYKGKKLSIYGDSISTFAGWIPQGNAVYYTGSNCDMFYVDDTWWMKTIKALQFDLLVNNSWSGRAVSSVRDGSSAHATDAGYKQANIDQLQSGNVLPEVIIIKLGINDFNNECPLGTYDGKTAVPTDPTTFSDAYAIMLDRIMSTYPLADVYCCTLMSCEKNGAVGFPETNGNGNTIDEFNEVIKNLASAFGAKVLNHHTCGITYYNLETYMGDYVSSSSTGLHPNPKGHSLIANATINEMDNAVRTRY